MRVSRLILAGAAILACNVARSAAPTPPAQPTTGILSTPAPTPTIGLPQREEAILILEPGPGSRLTSPLHISGIADSTVEQHLLIRLILDDGSELAAQPVIIQAELGQRGTFEGELTFSLSSERNALIQVVNLSARDGGVLHLASLGVTLTPTGPAEIREPRLGPEAIQILHPAPADVLRGGIAHVEGIGLASFEGTLVIEIYDVEGVLVGSMPIIVEAPEMGLPGPFSADVPYTVSAEAPGRVVVLDPLPAFNGLGHIASVEVTLAP